VTGDRATVAVTLPGRVSTGRAGQVQVCPRLLSGGIRVAAQARLRRAGPPPSRTVRVRLFTFPRPSESRSPRRVPPTVTVTSQVRRRLPSGPAACESLARSPAARVTHGARPGRRARRRLGPQPQCCLQVQRFATRRSRAAPAVGLSSAMIKPSNSPARPTAGRRTYDINKNVRSWHRGTGSL
jgi:hypothetical protein